MEKLFDVYVEIIDSVFVKGKLNDVNMISFTGKVKGKYFNGEVMGSGVDTQFIPKNAPALLSARYMLTGTDIDGNECRCFIENNGSFEKGFFPKIITDNPVLSDYEGAELKAEVVPKDNEVIISIYG
ncbi:MAG: hypothetical protein HDT44_06620 [Ruminococcaceae bacterium]|nr:hypothetical protein [Oscillospiraceae bacterium]